MKKRLLSAFMALALCLTLLPAPAWAAETENNIAVQANTANVAEVTIDGKTTQYADIVAAFDAAQLAESASVKLLTDVTTTSEITVDSSSSRPRHRTTSPALHRLCIRSILPDPCEMPPARPASPNNP